MPKELFGRIREILEAARAAAARSVNTAQVVAYWKIGKEIVEEEQKGKQRAGYGEKTLENLSARLTKDYGRGFSIENLKRFRLFFARFPDLLSGGRIGSPLVTQLQRGPAVSHASGMILPVRADKSWKTFKPSGAIGQPVVGQSWRPGRLHPSLSWRHYLTLLRIDDVAKRSFYEIESIKNNWSGRELERQINSLLYERLASSNPASRPRSSTASSTSCSSSGKASPSWRARSA